MAVTYLPIDGERVSAAWLPLLHDIRHIDKVVFVVGEGHRTWARQEELVRQKGVWSPSNPTGAATPSDDAPHIWTGRPDHAIDFAGDDAVGVDAQQVISAARKRGVTLRQTILPNEPWHVVPDLGDLRAYNERRRKKLAGMRHRVARARKATRRTTRRLNAAKRTLKKWAIR